jgi:hypothetical protein
VTPKQDSDLLSSGTGGSLTIRRPVKAPLLKKQLLYFMAFFALTATLSWQRGSFHAELGNFPDEPAHYITGLMVRDYLASGISTPPMQYAENYYRHYPKVALGHWPPMFYLVEAVWMLIFSVSRWSVLLLMSAQAAAFALVVQRAISRDLPEVYGAVAGVFFLSLPLVQRLSSAVMSDLLVAGLVFAGTLCFADYLATPDWRRAAAFGLVACLAVLTKGTGFVLALVPPFTVLLTGRIGLLSRLSFWIPAVIVVTVCGPWYVLAPAARHQDVAELGGIYPSFHAAGLSKDALRYIGILPLAFAAIGVCCRLSKSFREPSLRYRWATFGALLLAFITFRGYVGAAGEPRHILLVVAPTLWLAAVGFSFFTRTIVVRGMGSRFVTTVILLAVTFAISINLYRMPAKKHRGFDEVAQRLFSESRVRDSVILVSGDATSEGALIAEIAMREQSRPGHVVLRASKELSWGDWMGLSYTLRYRNPGDLLLHLDEARVTFVVVDPVLIQQPEDQRLLLTLPVLFPDRFELLGSYPPGNTAGAPSGILIYRFKPDLTSSKLTSRTFRSGAGIQN